MSEKHVTSEMLQRLDRRELAPAELLDVVRHLESCPACTRAAGARVPARMALEEDLGSESEHLDADTQLFPWVDGTIDPAGREIVETHLEDCWSCRAEAEDLRRLRRTAPRPRVARTWWAVAAASALIAGAMLVNRHEPAPDAPQRPRVVTRTPVPVTYANREWSALVDEVVKTQRLPLASGLDELRPAADPLRGSESGVAAALSPAGVVVATPRPRFRWPAADGADAQYVVSVFNGTAEVATSERLTAAEWSPRIDLPEARTLAWQVDVTSGAKRFIMPAPPAPPALFRIAPAADRAQLEAALAQHPRDHLLHAVLYARAGLAAEADASLQRAAAAGDGRAARIARAR